MSISDNFGKKMMNMNEDITANALIAWLLFPKKHEIQLTEKEENHGYDTAGNVNEQSN